MLSVVPAGNGSSVGGRASNSFTAVLPLLSQQDVQDSQQAARPQVTGRGVGSGWRTEDVRPDY